MSWLDQVFNVGYKNVKQNALAFAPQRTLNFRSGVTVTDSPLTGETLIDVTGGGGGGGGPTYNPAITASQTLIRPTNGWLYVPADTRQNGAAVTAKAWGSAQLWDRVTLGDDAWNTVAHAVSFDGNGIPVQNPNSQTFDVSSNVYTFLFDGESHDFVLTVVPSRNGGNPFWRAE